jgi:hypothetical protein
MNKETKHAHLLRVNEDQPAITKDVLCQSLLRWYEA